MFFRRMGYWCNPSFLIMARVDAIGLFWEDIQATGRSKTIRVMPSIPDTGWLPPTYLPDLSSAKAIAIDVETYDPDLEDYGPGWARGKGHLVGVSIGVPGGGRWYYPLRHEVEPEFNWPIEPVLAWLRDTLGNPKQPKIGANLTYDLGWLRQEGVIVKGELFDVQFAEALLDERAHVALEILATKYLGEGKESSLLYRWCSDYYGGAISGKQRANIYRAPARLVGPYAESDADLPLRLAEVLYPLIWREGLYDLFRMECDLIYLTLDMRFEGVSVDVVAAEKLRDTLKTKEDLEQQKLDKLVGFHVEINTSASLAKAFDEAGLPYPRTDKGNPSFTKGFLKEINHPISNSINEIRKLAKLRGTFVESYVLDSHVNGKVYGQFHLLRGDEGGTRSGRFSSSTPNLQNLPSRDDELAPLVRGAFIPDYGHESWRKYDYSQVEYRFLAHFAVGKMSGEVRDIFNNNPHTDYHVMTQDLVTRQTGQELSRKAIKNINFGLIYGMGVDALSAGLGLKSSEGKKLFAAYHEGAPFAKATMEEAIQEALTTGIIRTILGRKSRFDLWEPDNWGRDTIPLPYDQAILKYGNIRRAQTHKALNRKLQGSAADLMKKAMWICWKDGIFDETGTPRLTVHDELDFSDPGGKDEAFREMKRVLETAIPLKIPIIADCDIGPDWGHVKELVE